MNDNSYKVGDYQLFEDGISTTNAVIDSINTTSTTLNNSKSQLSNGAVFMGPICDSCLAGFDKSNINITGLTTTFGNFSTYLKAVEDKYKSGDITAENTIISVDGTIGTASGKTNVNGNVIDTSTPVAVGDKYNLSDEDLAYLAYVAYREQGSVEGAKMELSLMANLYEKNKSNYSNVKDYVDNSGWFASGSRSGYSYPGDDYYNAAKDVLNEGNRYVATNVDEHDCISDIESISTGDKDDRSNYIPGETIIHNRYGSTYTFAGFAPNGGDPFGYINA